LGTTNVDYSWDLYHHFQSLRTYRETRFLIDPAGFEVKTEQGDAYREEKIDLPDGWLRGFMTTQEAMGMPSQRVSLSREAVYSVLAFLKRHKAKKSPRAVRFELLPDKSPVIVLEPWEQRIESHGTQYDGPSTEPIRIWGARRLLSLARVLPLAERFDVYLLGTGLPSFWVAHMGEMKLTLGLSGWTTNDWTRGSALDLLAPPASISESLLNHVARLLKERRAMTLAQLCTAVPTNPPTATAALRRLAFSGQVTKIESIERTERAMLILGKVDSAPVEIIVDLDGRIRRGKCVCGHFRKYGIRNGPCRHMIALRYQATAAQTVGAVRTNGYASRN
jgi:hypothetical protein